MTGFGIASTQLGEDEVKAEVYTYNKRNLEIHLQIPSGWESYHYEWKRWIATHFQRGSIKVVLTLNSYRRIPKILTDYEQVDTFLKSMHELGDHVGVPFRPDSSLLLEVVDHLSKQHVGASSKPLWDDIRPVMESALQNALAMRLEEGASLKTELNRRCGNLQRFLDRIAERAEGSHSRYRELLLERLRKSGLELDLDDERVLKELAIYADRVDISEEIHRLRIHLEKFAEKCASEETESVGRTLDFLCQEWLREFNTISSKANDAEITQQVVEAKNEVERVREQVQNIE